MATTLLKAMPQAVSQKTALRWLEGKERSTWPKHDDEEAYQRCIGILEDIIEGQQQVIQRKETSRTDKEAEEKVKPFRAAVLAAGKDLKRWRSNPRDSMSWTTYVTVYLKSLFETLEETHFQYVRHHPNRHKWVPEVSFGHGVEKHHIDGDRQPHDASRHHEQGDDKGGEGDETGKNDQRRSRHAGYERRVQTTAPEEL